MFYSWLSIGMAIAHKEFFKKILDQIVIRITSKSHRLFLGTRPTPSKKFHQNPNECLASTPHSIRRVLE